MDKYYCVVKTESDYVIEADSEDEAYELAWYQAYSDGNGESCVVDVDVKKVVYQ